MEKIKLILLDETSGIYREYKISFPGIYPKKEIKKLLQEGLDEITEKYLENN